MASCFLASEIIQTPDSPEFKLLPSNETTPNPTATPAFCPTAFVLYGAIYIHGGIDNNEAKTSISGRSAEINNAPQLSLYVVVYQPGAGA